jgi:hypothetical protein
MNWNDILLAALGGGLGGALGGLLGAGVGVLLPQAWRRATGSIFAIVFAIVGARIAPMWSPLPEPAAVEAEILAQPEIRELALAWRESDPVSFASFVESVRAAARGGGYEAAVNQGRAQLIAASRQRFAFLDDAQTVAIVRLARDQMLELRASRPQVCQPLFHGGDFGDITPFLSEEIRAREISLLASAFRADPTVPREMLTDDALVAANDAVLAAMRAQVGDDIGLLAPDASISGREARMCEVAAALYDQLLSLPEPEAARHWRGLSALDG